MSETRPDAVLFDLPSALLASWSVWNAAAGSERAGRRWRAEYLRLTYGSSWYRPYETLVREAALATGLDVSAAARLEDAWDALPPWDDTKATLDALAGRVKLGVVTNCSTALGARAAALLGVTWDVVVTAEEAGFYKPHAAPYRMAMERLGVSAERTRFVAGSGYDLIGTSAVGLRTYWHNRVGLARPEVARAAEVESPTLAALPGWDLGTG